MSVCQYFTVISSITSLKVELWCFVCEQTVTLHVVYENLLLVTEGNTELISKKITVAKA